ncbi:MAG: 23S rRNA (guanosine(2251)-2'-O)-methyltransferase RlmB [Desulfuromonas sp.]|nr:23S rRNA (guanosine(2251)-2'-O)-methyltransferase RlmB [Desulfuromonas sp.]
MAEYIYGLNAVTEALMQQRAITTLWVVAGEAKPRIQAVLELARQHTVVIKQVPRTVLDQLVGDVGHQGVVIKLQTLESSVSLSSVLNSVPSGSRFFLLLDGVTDPHNFGALIRSAAAAGCAAVIVAKDRSCPVTAVVEKAAAGAVAHIKICRVTNLARAMEELKRAGVWIYGLAGEESSSIYSVDLSGDVALVAGSEGKGLRPLVRKGCDGIVSISMPGAIQSLNVSVASGVALFEVVRQKSCKA